jgi:hypothetical protein
VGFFRAFRLWGPGKSESYFCPFYDRFDPGKIAKVFGGDPIAIPGNSATCYVEMRARTATAFRVVHDDKSIPSKAERKLFTDPQLGHRV